jgi:hypothetical protein
MCTLGVLSVPGDYRPDWGTTALWKRLAGKKLFPRSTLIETVTVHECLKKLEVEYR